MIEHKFANMWENVRKFWHYPRINSPNLLEQEEAEEIGLGDEIAAIDMGSNQINVNKRNLEKRLGTEFLPQVTSHEVAHYKYMPYSLRNLVRLVGHADLVTKNLKHAQIIQNLYSDLCVNTKGYKKGDRKLVDLYRKLSEGNNSEAWQLYMATYENMIGCQGMIIPEPREDIKVKAKKLSDIVGSSMDSSNKWPDSIKEFAKVMKDYLRREDQVRKEAESQQGTDEGSENETEEVIERKEVKLPQEKPNIPDITKGLIDNHKAKDFLPYDQDKTPDDVSTKKIEKELDGLAKELGDNEFKRVVAGLGIGSRSQANVWLYRELAKEYTVFFPNVNRVNSGEFKETPVKWTLDEPFASLDMEYTLRQSPIIIPNVTTYKWKTTEGESYSQSKGTPDLLIVIDSSTSMPDPGEDMSFPVLSAMIAAQSALSQGNKVAVINFSSYFDSCDFTNQSNIIDEKLLVYFDGGTSIPGEEMVRLTSSHAYPIHTLIISDTDIQNLESEMDNLEQVLMNSKAGGSIFLCCEPSEKTQSLENIGYAVHFARDFNDLGNLTLEKSKELYAPV